MYPFTCGASVLPVTVIEAFTGGVDVIFLLVCGKESCRYYDGHEKINRNINGMEILLDDFGLESERLLLFHADEYGEDPLDGVFAETIMRAKEFDQNPYKPQTGPDEDGGDRRAGGLKPTPPKDDQMKNQGDAPV